MKTPRRKPILCTALTLVAALVTILSAFVWSTAMTGRLNARGTNALVVIWHGYADIMVHGLHGEYPRTSGNRTIRLSPALIKGYKLPSFWYQHDRPNGSLRIQIPLIIPLAVLLAWTAWGWFSFHRRRSRHQCHACGYPRLGLHSPTCPECGHTASP
jgi:hypothetical protein